jgi:hypothetical protein
MTELTIQVAHVLFYSVATVVGLLFLVALVGTYDYLIKRIKDIINGDDHEEYIR